MTRLLDDEAYATGLGRAAQCRVFEEFNVDSVVDAHLALYGSVC